MNLETKIEQAPRINSIYAKRLNKMGIKTIKDLVFYFPKYYKDFSNIIPISDMQINEISCIQGKILEIKNTRTFVKKIFLTKAIVQDTTGKVEVIWFNQPFLTKNLKPGFNVCLAGKFVKTDNNTYLSSPIYERILEPGQNLIHAGRLVPIYQEVKGVSSRWLRYILKSTLAKLNEKIPEILPKQILKQNNLLPIQKAVLQIHFPGSKKSARQAQKRFSFQELFFLQLFVLKQKIKMSREKAIPMPIDLKTIQKLVKSLPFKLTNAQRKCAFQILKDMEKSSPMARLLQGDVGSGKTIVAVIIGLNTAKSNYQTALMAPTEILASQHFENITELLKNFNVNIGLLTSKQNKIFIKKQLSDVSKKDLLEKIKNKEIDFLIGTHSLIQKNVEFANLALVILDEQHRFGTEQRAKLVARKTNAEQKRRIDAETKIPHLLSMTATPIPRSLALTIYGNLDLSFIDEMPKQRKQIITKIVSPDQRQETYEFIKNQVKNKKQVFVICPRIDPSEEQIDPSEEQIEFTPRSKTTSEFTPRSKATRWNDVKAVKQEYEKLSKQIFPDLKIAMLHGKMKINEKQETMQKFKDKQIDILIATSVVEVGIDIPNATVMMIEGTEKFGLAQLYQFRGRVGRSKYQSYCFLFTDSPYKSTQQRLKAIVKSKNGLELAEKDLKIRGPGDFLGKRQSGIPDLAMNALKSITLVKKVRKNALQILQQDPELKKYPLLKQEIKKFGEKIHLE